MDEIFGRRRAIEPVGGSDGEGDAEPPDKDSKLLDGLLSQETIGRGRPKALCYEDILFMIVRHPVTGRPIPAIAIKFIHHKGSDNKPKPYVSSRARAVLGDSCMLTDARTVFFFTPTNKLIFCSVSIIIALALHDQPFDAPSLTNAAHVLSTENRGPMICTALRWKESMLKVPVFRGFDGSGLSPDKPVPYDKLRDDMGRQSLDAGFEERWTPRFARRGAANSANGMLLLLETRLVGAESANQSVPSRKRTRRSPRPDDASRPPVHDVS